MEERKACSCKWPRCQSSSGWRRESRSGLPESAIRGAHSSSPVLPRRERGVLLLQHNSLSLSDFLKMLQISCLTVRRQQSCWKAGGPEGSYLTRSFSNIGNDQYMSKKIKNKSHGGICPRSSLNNPPFVLWACLSELPLFLTLAAARLSLLPAVSFNIFTS